MPLIYQNIMQTVTVCIMFWRGVSITDLTTVVGYTKKSVTISEIESRHFRETLMKLKYGNAGYSKCFDDKSVLSALMCFFKIILIYCESERSSSSASSRRISRRSESMVMLIFSFSGFIIYLTLS